MEIKSEQNGLQFYSSQITFDRVLGTAIYSSPQIVTKIIDSINLGVN